MQRILVWDLPTRLFHLLLAACVAGSFVSAKIGGNAMVWHGRFGLAVVGLLAFRLVWGFVGSTYARFIQFVRGPAAIVAYVRGQWHGEGHNPLGALSVLAMLGALLLQVSTGLFANDDIAFEGPLYALVGKEFSDRAVGIHRLVEPLIILLVVAHLAAIVFYVRFKKETPDHADDHRPESYAKRYPGGRRWRHCNRRWRRGLLHCTGDRPGGGVWRQRRLAAATAPGDTGERQCPGFLVLNDGC